jgi:acyl carrier protein
MYDRGEIAARVRDLLVEHGRMGASAATLPDSADLYDAGLSSMASVTLMLALEDAFDIEFPERLLKRRTFSSIAAITAAVSELRQEAGR